jgi:hypothetical protein
MALAGVLTDEDAGNDDVREAALDALEVFSELAELPPRRKMTPAELRSVFDDAGVTLEDCLAAFSDEVDTPVTSTLTMPPDFGV